MSSDNHYTLIEPPKAFELIDLHAIRQYRDLLWALVTKDFKVMYAHTILGYAWAVINPLFTVLILTFVFGVITQVDTGDTPHLLFTLAGTCGWTYIASVTSEAGRSIVGSRDLITKIYFPRVFLPLSKALISLVELGISVGCLLVLMAVMKQPLNHSIFLFPVFLLIVVAIGLGMGLWISALSIQYRDFFFVIPFLLRLGMFITPIAFPASAVPEAYRLAFYLNPLAGAVEGLRWSLLGGEALPPLTYLSIGIGLGLFLAGFWYFRRVENKMADII